MVELNWTEYLGKNIYVILKNGMEYNGHIVFIDKIGSELCFLEIVDKFQSRIIFATSEIKLLREKQ